MAERRANACTSVQYQQSLQILRGKDNVRLIISESFLFITSHVMNYYSQIENQAFRRVMCVTETNVCVIIILQES